MQEAEVARQLIADLQANMGIIAGVIAIIAVTGIGLLVTSLNRASQALRELRATGSGAAASTAFSMAGGQQARAFGAPANAPVSVMCNRPARGNRDLVSRRHVPTRRDLSSLPGPAPKPRPVSRPRTIV